MGASGSSAESSADCSSMSWLCARARSQAGLLWGPRGAQAVRSASGHPHWRARLCADSSPRAHRKCASSGLHFTTLQEAESLVRVSAGRSGSSFLHFLPRPDPPSSDPLPGSFQSQKRSCREKEAAALLLLLLSDDLLLFLRSTGLLSAAAPLDSFFLTFYLCSPSPGYVPPPDSLFGL